MRDLPAPAAAAHATELIPFAEGDSLFARYRWRAGLAASAMTGLAGLGAGIMTALFVSSFGLTAGLAAIAAGVVGMGTTANVAALFGNQTLRARLREALDLRGEDVEFVGLLAGGKNTVRGKLLTPQFETDDNVGFLAVGADHLRIHLEDGVLAVPRAEVRRITVERVVELPVLRWIRIEFYQGDRLVSFLLMSREGHTLRALRRATRALYERLVEWRLADESTALLGEI